MKNKSQKIEAVFDKDLEKVLKGLNLYEKIINREIKCYYCNKIVTIKNLQFIFSKDNKIKISCDSKKCIEKFREAVKNGG